MTAPDPLRLTLIDGIDYYIEAGRWVFTRDYHLRRGSCCENGCRHCPYRMGESAQNASQTGPAANAS